MTAAQASFGDLTDLAVAIGLVRPDGSFNSDWLTRPGDYLAGVLADDGQRQALLAFAASALAGEPPTTDADGRRWLPVAEIDRPGKPLVRLFVVVDDRAAGFVATGVGARLEVAAPHLVADLHIPLFRGRRGSASVPDNIYLGEPGADITLRVDLQLGDGAAAPNAAQVDGLNVSARVPTDGSRPQLAVGLRGLRLPGATAPRDIVLDAADPAGLTTTLRDLVFGLAQLGADGLTGSAASMAGLLGLLDSDTLPPLPLADVTTSGLGALAAWLDGLLAEPGTRAAWINHLAGLVGGVAAGDSATFSVNGARVTVGVQRLPGTTGAGRIVVTAGVALDAGPNADPTAVALSAVAELCAIDVSGPTITVLPSATAQVRIGPAAGPAQLIAPTGNPAVAIGAFRLGFEIASARPVAVVLAADRVRIGARDHGTVDLTNPGAVAEVVAGAGADLVGDLLARLGAAGPTLTRVLGLPGSGSACPLDPIAFVTNPVVALAQRWQCLLGHPDEVRALLGDVQALLADAAPITGDGSAPKVGQGPWRLPLVGPVQLEVWHDAATLHVGLSTTHSMDTLGQRCTVVETELRAELAEIDLAGHHARFATSFDARVQLRGRGSDAAVIPLGPFTFQSKPIALHLGWTAANGIVAAVDVREARLAWEERALFQVPIPVIAADGSVTLPPEGWRALEPIIGALALQHPQPWVAELVRLFGWEPGQPGGSGMRVGLDELVADARAALTDWLIRLALDDLKLLPRALDLVAWIFSGTAEAPGGLLTGLGVEADPLLLPLNSHPRSPALAVWVDAPPAATARIAVSADLRIWRPGDRGFPPAALAAAISAEAGVDPEVADLLRGRNDVAAGLEAVAARWEATDGVVIPPPSSEGDDAIHLVGAVDHRSLADVAVALVPDLAGLGGQPPVVLCVAVGSADASPFSAEAGDVVVDLTAPGLAAGAFSLPTAAPGRWVVALPERANALLGSDPPGSDGVGRQAERLGRLLDHLASLGQPLAIVAHGGAGHAAQLATSTRGAFEILVLAGTPVADVPLTALDAPPSGDALRLLAALLPPPTTEPEDDDLSLGRRLVTGMLALARRADPAGDLRAPTPPPAPGPTPTHRLFGALDPGTIERAMTAVVMARLSARARQRAAGEPEPTRAAWVSVRLPLPDMGDPGDPTVVSGWAQLDLVRAGRADEGVEIAKRPHLRTHFEVGRRDGGWLVGGPDIGRGTAAPPQLELRRLHLDFTVPLPGAGTVGDTAVVEAELVLHEARAFGIDRTRWRVHPLDASDGAVPLLPEVRALLSGAAGGWAAASEVTSVRLRAVLGALGVMASDGHLPDAIDHLLQDPDRFTDDIVATEAGRGRLVAALADLFGGGAGAVGSVLSWTADSATITADLAAGTLDIAVGAGVGSADVVALGVAGQFHYGPTADVRLTATAGATGVLSFATGPFTVTLADPFGAGRITLWPMGADAGATLARLVARFVPSEIARLGLDRLRGLDAGAQPVIDAVLDALRLLGPASSTGHRAVVSPGRFLADPGRWLIDALGTAGRVDAARVGTLFNALRPVLGINGTAGAWAPAPGVSLAAVADTSGRAALRATVDTSAFAPPGGARLWATLATTLAFGDGATVATFSGEIGSGTSGSVALTVANGIVLELRPTGRPAIRLYPDPAGLGALATAALAAGAPSALAMVLDTVAARSAAAGLEGAAGTLVAEVGDALALRVAGRFDPGRLDDLARHPGPYLADRAALLVTALAARIPPLLSLPATQLGITAAGGTLTVRVRELTLTVRPTPLLVSVQGQLTGLPGIEAMFLSIGADATGLVEFIVEVGPLPVSVGGAALRPYLRAAPRVRSGGEPRRIELGLGLNETGTRRLAGRWLLDPATFTLVVIDGGTASTD
ncbi:MAG: hypothetical protein H0W29_01020, partial [Gemmatimonadales bacterium]|nr:hypothetical protein [Gemmatimonadales bacterium]